MTTPLLAWRGELSRDECLERARAHIAADLLRHGEAGNVLAGEHGCSVSCTVGTYDHTRYPALLGLPEWIAHSQDCVYEHLPRDERHLDVAWTEDLLSSIAEGVEVDRALRPILTRILEEVALPAVTVDNWGVRDAIEGVIAALRGSGDLLTAARAAARDAAEAARAAAEAAARAAVATEATEAAWAAWAAARAAAEAAGAADWAAAEAAEAARAAAEAAEAARAAAEAADWAAAEAADWAARAAAWAARAAAWAARDAAWERIRAIVLDELRRLEPVQEETR